MENAPTFLFTDIVGSTRRWEADAAGMAAELAAYESIIAGAVTRHDGAVFKNTGDGFCAVFHHPRDAVEAAVEAQRTLPLPTRMAVHAGDAIERNGDFFGLELSRCARLMDAGHGGQVLVSGSALDAAGDALEWEVRLKDLGEHRLRDLSRPEAVFQVLAPGLGADFPPLRTLEAVRHNLPLQRSSFIGRDRELAQVRALLSRREPVTLTGAGGSGKTRLALEAAAAAVGDYPDGVFFVDLAALTRPELVSEAVALALNLELVDSTPQGLAAHLGTRRVLVVLDNCEHVLDACAQLVATITRHCDAVEILSTSREALGVDGERVFRVPSMEIEGEAARLFLERAVAVRPELDVGPRTQELAVEICRRLDGIPLAIELAAARAAHLAPAEILERLSDRFRLLVGGRQRAARQRTLVATIEWSHDLLNTDERLLFRRLAVFRGTFSLRAAEEICHPDAMELLGSLAAKSLVNLEGDSSATRYRMLESVRTFAADRLDEACEGEKLRSAHCDWFLAWIESLPVHELTALDGGHQIEADADNLTAALEWCRLHGAFDRAARLAGRMVGYWFTNVRLAEMATWWMELSSVIPESDSEARALALIVGVRLALAVGDYFEMERRSAEVLRLASPNSWVAVAALMMQGAFWEYVDVDRSDLAWNEARRTAMAIGMPMTDSAWSAWYVSRLERAADRTEISSILDEWMADHGHHPPHAIQIGVLALFDRTQQAMELQAAYIPQRSPLLQFVQRYAQVLLASSRGDRAAMLDELEQLVALVREHGVPLGEAACLSAFAKMAVDERDYERSCRLLATVRATGTLYRSPMDRLTFSRCLRITQAHLDPDRAKALDEEGRRVSVGQALDSELHARGIA